MRKKVIGILFCMLLIAATVLPVAGNVKIGSLKEKQVASSYSNAVGMASLNVLPPDEEWNTTIGGLDVDELWCVQQTTDGGYIMTGCTKSYGPNLFNFWLVKINTTGALQWRNNFGSAYGYSVRQTTDGGYILGGYHWRTQTDRNARLIKTDSSGNMQWDKSFGGLYNEWFYSVNLTDDGGYILTGMTESYGAGSYDAWLIKTDSSGNEQLNKTFGGTGDDVGRSAHQVSDGGYIISGTTISYGAGAGDVWLIKTDSSGNKQWDKTFGGPEGEVGYRCQKTIDGGFIIVGYTKSYSIGENDVYLIKTNAAGNKQWDKTFGGIDDDVGFSVQQTDDGYIITGYTKSYGAGAHDVWLIKTDSSGNEQWNKTFGSTDYEEGWYVQQTLDGGYIITGYTSSYGGGMRDGWLIKTTAEKEPTPDLSCEGDLNWVNVTAGSTVNGSFMVENVGDSGTQLDWKVEKEPSWGSWTFEPESGEDLTPEDGSITVNVTVIAPDKKNKEFTGSIKLINKNNSMDYCNINVKLVTPKNKPYNRNLLLQRFLENHLRVFPFLRKLLRL
jgi:hypothetical protein